MSTTVSPIAEVANLPPVSGIEVERALALISYGWISGVDPLQELLQMDRSGMPVEETGSLRRFVKKVNTIVRGGGASSPLINELGDREVLASYPLDDLIGASTVGDGPFNARLPFLRSQALQDRQMGKLRDNLPRLEPPPAGGSFRYLTYRSLPSAMIPSIVEPKISEGNGESAFTVHVGTPFVSTTRTLSVSNTEGEVNDLLHSKSEYVASRYNVSEVKGEGKTIKVNLKGRVLKEMFTKGVHFEVQMSKMEFPLSQDACFAALTKRGGVQCVISSGIKFGDKTILNCVFEYTTQEMARDPNNGSPVSFGVDYRLILRLTFENLTHTDISNLDGALQPSGAFFITAMQLNSYAGKLTPTGQPWLPHDVLTASDNPDEIQSLLSIARVSMHGQERETDLSIRASLVDSWTMLPLTLKDHPDLLQGSSAYRPRVAITKMGLELEDIENMYDTQSPQMDALHANLFGRMLAVFAGEDIRKGIEDDRLNDYYNSALQYVTDNSGPAITHSGIVRTTTPEDGGTFTKAKVILARLMLSRLVTTGIRFRGESSRDAFSPFHMWSPQDMHSFKIPYCVSSRGIFVYSCDDLFVRLLSAGERWEDKNVTTYRSPRATVAGEIFAPLYKRTDKSTHSVVLPNGKEVCCDGIIHDMAALFLRVPEQNRPATRFVVWHPAFCIIMKTPTKFGAHQGLNATVIDGPRASRIVRPYKNTLEVKQRVRNFDLSVHEAMVISAAGYTEALLNFLSVE
uniref:Uncharacterized protein n=1 Tax=viral metagenome TaxID=1070528 RepID=A0A2V0RJF4_9ZZZZ